MHIADWSWSLPGNFYPANIPVTRTLPPVSVPWDAQSTLLHRWSPESWCLRSAAQGAIHPDIYIHLSSDFGPQPVFHFCFAAYITFELQIKLLADALVTYFATSIWVPSQDVLVLSVTEDQPIL